MGDSRTGHVVSPACASCHAAREVELQALRDTIVDLRAEKEKALSERDMAREHLHRLLAIHEPLRDS